MVDKMSFFFVTRGKQNSIMLCCIRHNVSVDFIFIRGFVEKQESENYYGV